MKMHRIYSIFVGSILIGLCVVHGVVVNDIESKNLTIHTLNEAVNRLTLDKSAIYRAFVTSDDRVRNIILKQTIQPGRRNFFGLIIIPCECRSLFCTKDVWELNFFFLVFYSFCAQIYFVSLLQRDFGHFIQPSFNTKWLKWDEKCFPWTMIDFVNFVVANLIFTKRVTVQVTPFFILSPGSFHLFVVFFFHFIFRCI